MESTSVHNVQCQRTHFVKNRVRAALYRKSTWQCPGFLACPLPSSQRRKSCCTLWLFPVSLWGHHSYRNKSVCPAMYRKSSLSFQALTNYKHAHIQQGDGPGMYMQEHLRLICFCHRRFPIVPHPLPFSSITLLWVLHKRKEIAFDCP